MATKQNSGVVDSSGNPVLDGSDNPIMSGRFPDEDEITARGRARNAAMFKSFANRLTGKKEEAKKAAPAVSRPTRPGQETSGAKPAASKPVASKTKPAAKAKPAIVTKEQLAKSGFTNLRDYLNDQKKLKRRDGKAPEKAKPSTPAASRPTRPSQQTSGVRPSGVRPKATKRSIGDAVSEAEQLAKQRTATDSLRNVSRSAAKSKSDERKATEKRQIDENTALTKRSVAARVGRAESVAENARKARQNNSIQDSASGYKKGGKVCMASKRADGIAVKGKTRGKVY